MAIATFQILRGDANDNRIESYSIEVSEGMVVLDAVHAIQATQANDLAVRWNCKAGKCGSCSAEINGMPKLMCMTRLSDLPLDKPVLLQPMKAFPSARGSSQPRAKMSLTLALTILPDTGPFASS